MRTINKKELDLIIKLHLKYLQGQAGGVRADLRGANLRGADLSSADLRGANLRGVNLSRANLSDANLSGVNLSRADLSGADLSGANLSRANLYDADLRGADLSGANLSRADLSRADLGGATIDVDKIESRFSIVPEEGPFYAYKKLQNNVIATLYVPRSAKRLGGLLGRKCRVSKVKVVSLSTGTKEVDSHSGKLTYEVGKWVIPDSFDENLLNECTNGIHVFITKKEAERY